MIKSHNISGKKEADGVNESRHSAFKGESYTQKEVEMNESKQQRIRVCLKAYDHKLIDLSASKIVEVVKRTEARVAGPVPLPTKRRLYCVLRSPHVDKKSREHFEMRIHKRIIDIYDPTAQTTEELTRMDLPAGVDIEVKL